MPPAPPKLPTFDVESVIASEAAHRIWTEFQKRKDCDPAMSGAIVTIYETLDTALGVARDWYSKRAAELFRSIQTDAAYCLKFINARLLDTTTEYDKFAVKVYDLLEEKIRNLPPADRERVRLKMTRQPNPTAPHDAFRYELSQIGAAFQDSVAPADPLHTILERLTVAVEQNTAALKLLAEARIAAPDPLRGPAYGAPMDQSNDKVFASALLGITFYPDSAVATPRFEDLNWNDGHSRYPAQRPVPAGISFVGMHTGTLYQSAPGMNNRIGLVRSPRQDGTFSINFLCPHTDVPEPLTVTAAPLI